MCLATAVHSLPPLFVELTNGSQAPFLFNTLWRLTAAAGVIVYLLLRHWEIIKRLDYNIIKTKCRTWDFLWGTTFIFDYSLFAWSTRFIETTVSASLISLWAIFYIIIRQRDDKNLDDKQYTTKITSEKYVLLCFAAFGFFFVVISESGQLNLAANSFHLLIGTSLALLSAYARANMAKHYKWAQNLYKDLYPTLQDSLGDDKSTKDKVHVVIQCLGFVISVSLIIPINLLIGLITETTTSFSLSTWLLIGLGGAITTFAPITFRWAQVLTKNVGVTSITYFQPVLSLGLLAMFPTLSWLPAVEINLVRIDYLIMGTAAIVAVNILINFKGESYFRFPWLIISLWTCGWFVLIRDSYFQSSRLDKRWLWESGNAEYYALVALSAMIFILILEFRTSRLADRINNEEALATSLYMISDDDKFKNVIKTIDQETKNEELEKLYNTAKKIVDDNYTNSFDFRDKPKIKGELKMLVFSKKKERDFSDRIVLIFFGIITITITLSTRPGVQTADPSLTGFIIDLFAILFSAGVVFMIITLFDLKQERKTSIFDNENGIYDLDPRDTNNEFQDNNNKWNRYLSIGLSAAMILVFSFLLWVKWIGIWCLSTAIGWGDCPF